MPTYANQLPLTSWNSYRLDQHLLHRQRRNWYERRMHSTLTVQETRHWKTTAWKVQATLAKGARMMNSDIAWLSSLIPRSAGCCPRNPDYQWLGLCSNNHLVAWRSQLKPASGWQVVLKKTLPWATHFWVSTVDFNFSRDYQSIALLIRYYVMQHRTDWSRSVTEFCCALQ